MAEKSAILEPTGTDDQSARARYAQTYMQPANANHTVFTPRSNSFPDQESDMDYDDRQQHTPISSTDQAPFYEELPPTYEQSQARAQNVTETTINDDSNLLNRLALSPVSPMSTYQTARQTLQPHDSGSMMVSPLATYQNPQHPAQPQGGAQISHAQVAIDDSAAGRGMDVQVQQSQPIAAQTSNNNPSEQRDRILSVQTPTDVFNQRQLHHALEFTRIPPEPDVQSAPRLARPVAIPPDSGLARGSRKRDRKCGVQFVSQNGIRFARAYSKGLQTRSIDPAVFATFIDNLNVLLANEPVEYSLPTSQVSSFISGSNETFFGPRGLKVRFSTLNDLLETINYTNDPKKRSKVLRKLVSKDEDPRKMASELDNLIGSLMFDLPESSVHTTALRGMAAPSVQYANPIEEANRLGSPTNPSELPHVEPQPVELPADSVMYELPAEPREPVELPAAEPVGQSRTIRAIEQQPTKSTAVTETTGTPVRPNEQPPSPQQGIKRAQTWQSWGANFGNRMEHWGQNLSKRIEKQAEAHNRSVQSHAEALSKAIESNTITLSRTITSGSNTVSASAAYWGIGPQRAGSATAGPSSAIGTQGLASLVTADSPISPSASVALSTASSTTPQAAGVVPPPPTPATHRSGPFAAPLPAGKQTSIQPTSSANADADHLSLYSLSSMSSLSSVSSSSSSDAAPGKGKPGKIERHIARTKLRVDMRVMESQRRTAFATAQSQKRIDFANARRDAAIARSKEKSVGKRIQLSKEDRKEWKEESKRARREWKEHKKELKDWRKTRAKEIEKEVQSGGHKEGAEAIPTAAESANVETLDIGNRLGETQVWLLIENLH